MKCFCRASLTDLPSIMLIRLSDKSVNQCGWSMGKCFRGTAAARSRGWGIWLVWLLRTETARICRPGSPYRVASILPTNWCVFVAEIQTKNSHKSHYPICSHARAVTPACDTSVTNCDSCDPLFKRPDYACDKSLDFLWICKQPLPSTWACVWVHRSWRQARILHLS